MIVALLAMMTALADPPADNSAVPTIHAETRIVPVDVVVTDSKGRAVTGLRKEDFTLLDNGKPRQIDVFSVSRDEPEQNRRPAPARDSLPPNTFSNRNAPPPLQPPHATVIVIDASPSDPIHDMMLFRQAQGMAAARVMNMKPDEQIAVYVTAKHEGLKLLQDYTNDKALLLKKIRGYEQPGLFAGLSPWMVIEPVSQDYKSDGELLRPPVPPKPPRSVDAPGRSPNLVPARETEGLIDFSVRENRMSLQTIAERLALLPGRKNIFWATAGMPPGQMRGVAWEHTFTALNEANVAVNTGGCSVSSRAIADATGGAATCEDSPAAVAVIDAARVTYTLAFYLTDGERDDTYRSIKVNVNRPHVNAFYRQGYYAGKAPDALIEKKPELEAALLTPGDSNGVGITARVTKRAGSPNGMLTIQLNLDPTTLSLKQKNSGWVGAVDEMAVELNGSGNLFGRVADKRDFRVAADKRGSYDANGVGWPLDMQLVPGATKVTIVVRDDQSGHLGSLTIPLADVK